MVFTSGSKQQLPTPYVVDVIFPTYSGNRTYIPKPPMEKEKTIIWASQVLTPFSISGSVHAFLGHLPKSSTKPVKLNKFFPCLPYCKPRAFEDKIFELGIIDSPSLCIMFFSFYQQ